MTAPADLIITNAEVHTLGVPDETAEAVAIRDGQIVHVGRAFEATFHKGLTTHVIDLDGRIVVPGFIDAHTHLPLTGRYQVYTDLRTADRATCLNQLRTAEQEGWILGFGFDESTWEDPSPLTREELDGVSTDKPVVAFREDMHVAAVNSIVLEEYADLLPDANIQVKAGEPTGVVVEDAVEALWGQLKSDPREIRRLLEAAQALANRRGVTSVHDMIREPLVPRTYRELDLAGELSLRVRLNYWSDFLEALIETGLRTNHGSDLVRTGAVKTYTDGTFGGRTARLSEPYDDVAGNGQWVVPPEELHQLVERATDHGYQMAVHAIGDVAIETTLDVIATHRSPDETRHRVEHAELLPDDLIERMAELDVVASVQPNFLKWAGPEGLYATRLGSRRLETNRFRDLHDAGVPLAFGSDGMPLDPLFGIHQTVNAPHPSQQLSVTEALRAYTYGGAYAAGVERSLGTIEPGKRADLTILDRSPWDHAESIQTIGVDLTVVDGTVVYDGR